MTSWLILLVFAVPSILYRLIFAAKRKRDNDARIAEIRLGAPERYFEERRALEAYPPVVRFELRLAGAILLIASCYILWRGGAL